MIERLENDVSSLMDTRMFTYGHTHVHLCTPISFWMHIRPAAIMGESCASSNPSSMICVLSLRRKNHSSSGALALRHWVIGEISQMGEPPWMSALKGSRTKSSASAITPLARLLPCAQRSQSRMGFAHESGCIENLRKTAGGEISNEQS